MSEEDVIEAMSHLHEHEEHPHKNISHHMDEGDVFDAMSHDTHEHKPHGHHETISHHLDEGDVFEIMSHESHPHWFH